MTYNYRTNTDKLKIKAKTLTQTLGKTAKKINKILYTHGLKEAPEVRIFAHPSLPAPQN